MGHDERLRAPLDDALDRVRHDLTARGLTDVSVDAAVDAAAAHRRWWLAEWPDGGEHVACLLAQDVQEALHESVDPTWPLCPDHRDHPLFIEPDLGPDPFWVCHRTGLPVAPVGAL